MFCLENYLSSNYKKVLFFQVSKLNFWVDQVMILSNKHEFFFSFGKLVFGESINFFFGLGFVWLGICSVGAASKVQKSFRLKIIFLGKL